MSDVTVESLQVEIQANSSSAANGIDALVSSLGKLKNATKGGAGLQSVVNQLSTIKTALSGVSDASVSNLSKLAESLQVLSKCGSIKLSSSIAAQITNIGAATKALNGTSFSVIGRLAASVTPLTNLGKVSLNSLISQLQRLPVVLQSLSSVSIGTAGAQIRDLVSALEPLTRMGKNNLTSFVTQLNKIPDLVTNLKAVDWHTLREQIQALTEAFSPLATKMQAIANGFAAFPARIQRLITSTEKMNASNNKATAGYTGLALKGSAAYLTISRIARVFGAAITKTNQYIENMNLFSVAMGEFTKEAKKYAEQVGEVMGINPGEFMRNQGVFMTLTKGFGVAGDRAQVMSQNLTQLGYDLTSFYNLEGGVAEGMQKLQSGIAGELEPLRRLGYDLSNARLQQEAYTLGITKSVSAMNQAEKAELRYYTIMKQVSWVQGDMARTLESPANQLRVLKAQLEQCGIAWGNVLLPALKAVIPYAVALVKVLRLLAEALASAFNIEIPEFDGSSIADAANSSEDIADGLADANKEAKALKNALLGMDELNIISPESPSSESVVGDVGSASVGALPTYGSFLAEEIEKQADEIVEKMSEVLATALSIGAAFLSWAVPKTLTKTLEWLTTLKGSDLLFSISFRFVELALFLDAWNTLKEAIDDIQKNKSNFSNITKLISGFAEALAAGFFRLGNVKLTAVMLLISGITGLLSAIGDMAKNGRVSVENALTVIKSVGMVITAIGLLGNNQVGTGVGLMISGVSLILQNVKDLLNGFTTGDFSNVNWIETAIGAIMLISGLLITLKKFDLAGGLAGVFDKTKKTVKSAADTTKSVGESVGNTLESAGKTAQSVGQEVGKLSSKLTSLAKNLAMGLVIIVEVAAAVLMVVGTVVLLGIMLEQVAIAWKPVIDNGGTVAIAMGIGIVTMAAIGAVTALLGSIGMALIGNIALGTIMLAALGVATGVFLLEIWAIGKGLDEIGKAWQPVLDNGETIAIAIGIGTALLIGIGAVCALLGVAAVASVGLLPIAIGLGIGMLVELGVAAALFLVEVWAIGKGLNEIADAWQPVLSRGDEIKQGIVTGTQVLVAIGAVCAALGVVTVASGALLPVAIGLGTAMLLKLGVAFVVFSSNMTNIASSLADELYPALARLNKVSPALLVSMDGFISFFAAFAKSAVEFSKNSVVAGLTASVDKIIDFFLADPVARMSENVEKQYNQATSLVNNLKQAIPKLDEAQRLLSDYRSKVELLQIENKKTDGGSLITVGISLVTEGWEGAKNVINSVIGGVETLVNSVITGINTMINALNKLSFNVPDWIPVLGGKQFGFNMSTISTISIPRLAAGGIVDRGQMFIAREAGAELVGNVGGRTGVVNNDQIVESVSKGVYNAVVSAMAATASRAGGSGETVVKVYLDSKEITARVEKRQRERGVDVLGGVVYG